jgi:4'-phosphopantetheinyl transferase
MKQVAVEPHGVSVKTYIESMAHKLTPPEMQSIALELGGEVVLRRLCILLALKAAYIKAIGQPAGFDWARLEFDIPLEAARADGHPLQGWEFRIFRASLGVARKDVLVEEHYQCVYAFFRGAKDSTFVWHKSAKDLESWVQLVSRRQTLQTIKPRTSVVCSLLISLIVRSLATLITNHQISRGLNYGFPRVFNLSKVAVVLIDSKSSTSPAESW